MSEVIVRYKQGIVPEAVLTGLGPLLQHATAAEFTCGSPGGQLTEGEIDVFFIPCGPYDSMGNDLAIHMDHKDFPLRRHGGPEGRGEFDFQERCDKLQQRLEESLPAGLKFGLWVDLKDAEWREGESLGRPLAHFQSGV
jgi:hypothetical protein